MKHRRLGRTNLHVSEISFGAWAIGGSGYGPTNDAESLLALETAWEKGVNFFDTADTYGHGHSEELLSRFLANKPRDHVILASKAGWDFYPAGGDTRPGGPHSGGSKKNFAPDYLRFACEESLKRLKVDSIDLYQLHNPSLELIKSGEPIGVLEKLKQEGKIRFIGISVHTENDALSAIEDSRVDTLQLAFHFLDQRMAENVFSKSVEADRGIIVREPLACGLLSGKYQSADHEFHKEDHRRRWTREKLALDLEKISAMKKILFTERFSMARAALEYILEFSEVGTVIPGAKTKAQVLDNIKASRDPQLRSQEAFLLKQLYHREEIFRKFL